MPVNDYRSGGSYDRCEVAKVKGEGGAKALNLPPNSSFLAMDIDDPVVYLIQTDAAGYHSVEAYSVTRIPTESEKAASAIEQVTQALSKVVTQMDEMTSRMDGMAGQINKLEMSLNGP